MKHYIVHVYSLFILVAAEMVVHDMLPFHISEKVAIGI